jgi:hypothetical protein
MFMHILLRGVTPDFDYRQNCTKKNSVLNYISKHTLYSGDKGEIIKFNSYTAFDVQNVMSGALTTPFTLKSGIIQTVKVAFGTTAALGYSGSSGGCTAIIGESQGIYGSAPDVIITFE